MRLLFLTLAALALLPQVIPGFGGKKCWQKAGNCKRYCRVNEELKAPCGHHQVCCVPVKKIHKPVSPVKEVPRTFPTQASHLPASPMDFIVRAPSTYPDMDLDFPELEKEQSDQVLDTEMSTPPVHQSS
ncbi:defensin beta 118 [Phyllostomus discolor]|uniref:Defensin beta 118 n=1 Tax=Phyllostomus discolor TaxID=89673 RepID=A0A833Z770_9CHIR|nr:defensin beta 118 [Phyllostomus discolor]